MTNSFYALLYNIMSQWTMLILSDWLCVSLVFPLDIDFILRYSWYINPEHAGT